MTHRSVFEASDQPATAGQDTGTAINSYTPSRIYSHALVPDSIPSLKQGTEQVTADNWHSFSSDVSTELIEECFMDFFFNKVAEISTRQLCQLPAAICLPPLTPLLPRRGGWRPCAPAARLRRAGVHHSPWSLWYHFSGNCLNNTWHLHTYEPEALEFSPHMLIRKSSLKISLGTPPPGHSLLFTTTRFHRWPCSAWPAAWGTARHLSTSLLHPHPNHKHRPSLKTSYSTPPKK